MLVFFVNHSTAPVNLGGAERSMIRLVEDWYASDQRFEAVFITKAPRGKFIDALEERGFAYRAFPYRGWTIPNANQPRDDAAFFAHEDYAATLAIIGMMEERRPDLVVTNTIVAPWGAFAAAALGIPHAWFVREYGDLDHGLAFQTSRQQTFADIGLLSQAVFTNSLALKAHIGQYLDEQLVSVVYPRVDVADVQALAEEPLARDVFPAGGLKITVVGRLSESKGQWRVIDALGDLAARGIATSLCLVGGQEDPEYVSKLRARATRAGVGTRVVFAGEQANPFPYVRAADVCVTSSGIEAFGRTTLEYMVAGKPVVASAGGGSGELVLPGETGYLFDPSVPNSLSEQLERYARDPLSMVVHGAAGAKRATQLMEGDFSNARAIERLRNTADAVPYLLPNIARYWFALPRLYFTPARRTRITAGVVASRLCGRLRSLLHRAEALRPGARR